MTFFLKVFESVDSLIAFNTESGSENIINLLLVSQVLIKSKARSTAFGSSVKTVEPSGLRCILQWLFDITALPNFESFLTYLYKYVNNPKKEFVAII